jgi:hypothetical protein
VVEHLSRHPYVEGFNLAKGAGVGKENGKKCTLKRCLLKFKEFSPDLLSCRSTSQVLMAIAQSPMTKSLLECLSRTRLLGFP